MSPLYQWLPCTMCRTPWLGLSRRHNHAMPGSHWHYLTQGSLSGYYHLTYLKCKTILCCCFDLCDYYLDIWNHTLIILNIRTALQYLKPHSNSKSSSYSNTKKKLLTTIWSKINSFKIHNYLVSPGKIIFSSRTCSPSAATTSLGCTGRAGAPGHHCSESGWRGL